MNEQCAALHLVQARALDEWMRVAFSRSGLSNGAARITASAILRTSLRGIDTHGVARMPAYVDSLRNGTMNAACEPRVSVVDDVIKVDGDNGVGPVVMDVATSDAAIAANSRAVTTVLIRSCGHMAALGIHLLPLVEKGLIGFLCQESPLIMALPGSRAPLIGNNPLAFACPYEGNAPIVFDMAASQAARGQIVERARRGETTIPPGWALDRHGQPTEDTAEALKGFLAPVGGPKGIGLAMLVSVLGGCVTGTRFDPPEPSAPPRSSAAGLSGMLIVINPERLMPRAEFNALVSSRIGHFRNSVGSTGRYPGQRANECEVRRRSEGIPIAPELWTELERVARELNCPMPDHSLN